MSMYNQYSLYQSHCPPFHPSPNDHSLVELQIKKPSFLIGQPSEPVKNSYHQTNNYPLSAESLARLDRIDRNPFIRSSKVHLKYPLPEDNKKEVFRTSPNYQSDQPHLEESHHFNREESNRFPSDLRNILSGIIQDPSKIVPAETQREDKKQRIEEILAEVGRMHFKEEENKREKTERVSYRPMDDSQFPFHREESWKPNQASRETPTIIQQLGEEHLMHRLESSQVEEYGNIDPIAYWARKESGPPQFGQKPVSSPMGRGDIPSNIRVRGDSYVLIPLS